MFKKWYVLLRHIQENLTLCHCTLQFTILTIKDANVQRVICSFKERLKFAGFKRHIQENIIFCHCILYRFVDEERAGEGREKLTGCQLLVATFRSRDSKKDFLVGSTGTSRIEQNSCSTEMKGTRQIELDVEQWWLAVESKVVIVSDWRIWLDAEYSEYAEYYTDLIGHV